MNDAFGLCSRTTSEPLLFTSMSACILHQATLYAKEDLLVDIVTYTARPFRITRRNITWRIKHVIFLPPTSFDQCLWKRAVNSIRLRGKLTHLYIITKSWILWSFEATLQLIEEIIYEQASRSCIDDTSNTLGKLAQLCCKRCV